MQSPRITQLFLILLLSLTGAGCAFDQPPSGGNADITPLQVMQSYPAPTSIHVSTQTISLTFNHVISNRQLIKALSISPSIGGRDIAIQGNTVIIRADKPFERNRTYLLTLDKNLEDNRGISLSAPYTLAFSTGDSIDGGVITGRVINADFSPAGNALILAFAEQTSKQPGNLLHKVPEYITQTDTSGSFALKNIAHGSYKVVAVNDRNNDLRYNEGIEEIGMSSTALIATGSPELLFRLSGKEKETLPLRTIKPEALSSETGGISGSCIANGKNIIVEASGITGLYQTVGSRERNGICRYTFRQLPAGSYTVSAFVPSDNKKAVATRRWNPGTIEPFQPAEPFGIYPHTVIVRARWTTDHIDFHVNNSL